MSNTEHDKAVTRAAEEWIDKNHPGDWHHTDDMFLAFKAGAAFPASRGQGETPEVDAVRANDHDGLYAVARSLERRLRASRGQQGGGAWRQPAKILTEWIDREGPPAMDWQGITQANEDLKAALRGQQETEGGAEPVAWVEPGTLNSYAPEDFLQARSEHPEDYAEWFPVYARPPVGGEAELREALEYARDEVRSARALVNAYLRDTAARSLVLDHLDEASAALSAPEAPQ